MNKEEVNRLVDSYLNGNKVNTIDLWAMRPRTTMPLISLGASAFVGRFEFATPSIPLEDDGIERQDISKLFEEKVKSIQQQ